MIQRIEASGYRCLRSVNQPIDAFEILIGANASGKSTFLDVVAFLGDLISQGLEAAVEKRTANFHDLVWGREADHFELAIEARIPDQKRVQVPMAGSADKVDTIRYNVGIRLDTLTEKLHIVEERVAIYCSDAGLQSSGLVVSRSDELHFINEVNLQRYEREPPHRNYSALNMLPVDAEFPASAWLREQLRVGIKPVMLDIVELRKPSPPATSDVSESSGAFLARSISQLKARNRGQFDAWLAHVQTVLPEVKDVRTVLNEADRHRYVVIDYDIGDRRISVPSWMASDGTLRLFALTLLGYAPGFSGVYLVKEPENGVRPTALQAIYESLSSVYEGQVLVASHSPVLLGMAKPEQLLCFLKTAEGIRIVRGSQHEALRDWRGEVSLGVLAASGILG